MTPLRMCGCRRTTSVWLMLFLQFSLTCFTNYCPLPKKNETIINLNTCGLTSIPGALREYPDLKVLYLQNNNIQHIDADLLSDLKHLTGIYLANNNISEIPNLFSDSIEIIDLSFNKLKGPVDINKFRGVKNLTTVFLNEEICEPPEDNLHFELRCGDHIYKPKPSHKPIINPPLTPESMTPTSTLTTSPTPSWRSSPALSPTTPNSNEDRSITTTLLPEILTTPLPPTRSPKPAMVIPTTEDHSVTITPQQEPGHNILYFIILGAIFLIIIIIIVCVSCWFIRRSNRHIDDASNTEGGALLTMANRSESSLQIEV